MYRAQNEAAAWGSITFLNKAAVLEGDLLPRLLVSLPGPLDSSSILILATNQGGGFYATGGCPANTAGERLDIEY